MFVRGICIGISLLLVRGNMLLSAIILLLSGDIVIFFVSRSFFVVEGLWVVVWSYFAVVVR